MRTQNLQKRVANLETREADLPRYQDYFDKLYADDGPGDDNESR